ncbi:hypothetical protein FHETE_10691 [Fusarium heterosporum]|uniref:DUF6603 domain-containing protein n=1 Tax=Fusarium heterosporum TaxID=42747 RepID=A0A8H5SUA4_FUSHE|nr:hypothetical protein FHETE_10691 [Fusarium heterosporum]
MGQLKDSSDKPGDLPPRALALRQTAVAASGDGQQYTIYSSTAGQAPGDNVMILATGSSTDAFVGSMNTAKCIILTERPDPTASFDASDQTLQWLTSIDSGVTANLTLDDNNNINSFAIQFQSPWSLSFSSDETTLGTTFAPPGVPTTPVTPRIPIPGIDEAGDMLTLGLDFTKLSSDGISATVTDLFNDVGQSTMISLLPPGIAGLVVNLFQPTPSSSTGQRNALWFVPGQAMQTTVRLQFDIPLLNALRSLLEDTLKGFTINSTSAIYRKVTTLANTEKGKQPVSQGSVTFNVDCSVQAKIVNPLPPVEITAGVEFAAGGIGLTLMFTTKNPLAGILQWLVSLTNDSTIETFVNTMLKQAEGGTTIFSSADLRRLSVELEYPSGPSEPPTLSAFRLDIEVTANFGQPSPGSSAENVVFLVSYNWDTTSGGLGILAGQLWNNFDTSLNQDLQPDMEVWTVLQPLTSNPANAIQIASLIPTQQVLNIPDTLPSEISRAYVSVSQNSFAAGGTVQANTVSASSVPQPYLGQVNLDTSFTWGESSDFTLDVSFAAGITPSTTSITQTPTVMTGSLSYASATESWDLKGSLTGLYASTLAAFFDPSSSAQVSPLLGSIGIETLTVEYKYQAVNGQSVGNEFNINGSLLIADVELELNFQSTPTTTTFHAQLNSTDESATIGDILEGILGSDGDLDLPLFVTSTTMVAKNSGLFTLDIVKNVVKPAETGKDGSKPASDTAIEKSIVKSTASAEPATEPIPDAFLLIAQITLGDLGITFAQLHSTDWEAGAPSKRLIQVSIQGFPKASIDIPVVGTIDQPLDELYFLWVQDPSQSSSTAAPAAGLSRQDLSQLNNGLSSNPILFKDRYKTPSPGDLIMAAGCHFAVIIKDSKGVPSCLLDFTFLEPTPKPPTDVSVKGPVPVSGQEKALTPVATSAGDPPPDDSGTGGQSTQAPFKKTAGPLSISNVSLDYKNSTLEIVFDATFVMGPVGFSLLGFAVGLNFTSLDMPTPSASLQGMAASFNKPPLTIAGTIRHGDTGGIDYYSGGLIVGFDPWQFEAAGFFGTVTAADPFETIFVFAKLQGPLVTLEFAEISGVTGGFGYNSSVRNPTVDQVFQFPFIDNTELNGDALAVLQTLIDPGPAGWFQPVDKTYWMAAGMQVDAFKMLSIDAVLVVQFGSAITLSVFAIATADIPMSDADVKFAHVELGISAIADLTYGTLKIDAALSPNSFILSQDCHLTGGAALYYWFAAPQADATMTGNFVFTIGGYHQAFNIPIAYPNPSRLQINWSLTSDLSITGQAYFAITPQVCMGGGRLHAAFSAGPIGAWFDAFADFLINYKPFNFNAQGGLSVGVTFNIDFLFIHTHISCEIGAELYLWGPPVAGKVHVDFWVTSFDISFGASQTSSDAAILLQDFYLLVLQTSSQTQSASIESPSDNSSDITTQGHIFTATSGLMNTGDSTTVQPNSEWTVRGGSFTFTISCKMAVTSAIQGSTTVNPSSDNGVYSRPMQLTSPMTSTLTIVSSPDAAWRLASQTSSVPEALWGKYDASTDPLANGGNNNNITSLLNGSGGTVPLMMGIEVTAPKSIKSPDPFPPMDMQDASLDSISATDPFPALSDADTDWNPAAIQSDIQEQYEAVFNSWVSPVLGTGATASMASGWAQALGWNTQTFAAQAPIPPVIKANFDNLYIAAPLVTAI